MLRDTVVKSRKNAEYAEKSQHMEFGRDLAISDNSEKQLQEALTREGFKTLDEPFDLGEISFHSGWTYHRAGPNTSGRAREVMTVIYMDRDMKLATPRNKNREYDWKLWCKDAKIGEVTDTPLNPVIYSK